MANTEAPAHLAPLPHGPLFVPVRCSRTEMRCQVATFLDSIEVGRYDAESVFQALVARFGPVRMFSVDHLDEFWWIIDRFDSTRA